MSFLRGSIGRRFVAVYSRRNIFHFHKRRLGVGFLLHRCFIKSANDHGSGMGLELRSWEDRLFNYLSENNDKVSIHKFKAALFNTGLTKNDPRLKECMHNLDSVKNELSLSGDENYMYIDREQFRTCISDNVVLIAKAFQNKFVIPEFPVFCEQIEKLYSKAKKNTSGNVASYIPQLSRYSPDLWGVSICTVDGQRYSLGDKSVPFCLQSVSKPMTYALLLSELGSDIVHEYIGQEPSGSTFNHISLNHRNKPHNPMINSGAIVVCSLLKQELNPADRFDFTAKYFKMMNGNEYLTFNNSVFLSERQSADRNFALGYYLRENKCFPENTNLNEILDFYFQLCSVEITCESGAVIGATLANGGVCPTTDEMILKSDAVRNTLSLMHSCGMYDYSGQFAFKVGLPAKSGVSGAILIVVPNLMGICIWSPPLDSLGNSCRGLQFAEDLVKTFNFHNYDSIYHQKKEDPRVRSTTTLAMSVVELLFSAHSGDTTSLRRCALSGMDMSITDYDGRTALHVAAAEGHLHAVEFLLEKCAVSPFLEDRWGFTPLDDAVKFEKLNVAEVLKKYMSESKLTDNVTEKINGTPKISH